MTRLTGSRAIGILLLRLTVGWIFLYAGIEKLFGATPFTAAGFLKMGTLGTTSALVAKGTVVNPTHDFWVALAASHPWIDIVNVLVPYGQIAIGLALILGLATRFAGAMGVLMMLFIGVASWSFANGVMNYHFLLVVSTIVLALVAAGEVYGLDAYVDETPLVKRASALRYVLG